MVYKTIALPLSHGGPTIRKFLREKYVTDIQQRNSCIKIGKFTALAFPG